MPDKIPVALDSRPSTLDPFAMDRDMQDLESTATASFAEFAGIEHILLGDLRQLLSEPLTEQSRVWIQKLLDMLLDLLPGQFAAEEADGYLQDVIDEHPSWSPRVVLPRGWESSGTSSSTSICPRLAARR